MTLSHLSAITCGQVSEVSSHGEASAPHFTPKIENGFKTIIPSTRMTLEHRTPGMQMDASPNYHDAKPTMRISGQAYDSKQGSA